MKLTLRAGPIFIKTDSVMSAILMIPLLLIGFYLLSCLALYAWTELTGTLEFSWINALWTMIILGIVYSIFHHETGE